MRSGSSADSAAAAEPGAAPCPPPGVGSRVEVRLGDALEALRAELEAPLLAFAAGHGRSRPAVHPAAPEPTTIIYLTPLAPAPGSGVSRAR